LFAGILVGVESGISSISGFQLVTLISLTTLFLIVFFPRSNFRWVFLGLLVFFIGTGRMQFHTRDLPDGHIAQFNDQPGRISITGLIVDDPDVRDRYVGLRIRAEKLSIPGSEEEIPVEGDLLAQASRFGDWEYGDRVQATGYLQTPPDDIDFSYRDYLTRQSIYSIMPSASIKSIQGGAGNPLLAWVYRYRNRALDRIYQLFPDPEASLFAGILVGVESGISSEVRSAFDRTGTTHIIAISGFNISILAALFLSISKRWFGVRTGILIAGVSIAVYTVLVGADAAVVRAAIMGGLMLLALRMGRQTTGMASIAAAAILMTAIEPHVLWDVGFQLSFAATMGLLLYGPSFEKSFEQWTTRRASKQFAQSLTKPVAEFLLFTLAAQLTTLPITAFYFHRFSLSSVLANPAILPAQPPLMILGGIATIAGTIWLPIGRLLAWIALPFASFTIRTVSWFSELPAASLTLGPVSPLSVGLFYAALFSLTVLHRIGIVDTWLVDLKAHFNRLQVSVSLLLVALAVCVGIMWKVVAGLPNGYMRIGFLDVGHGEAVHIQGPQGEQILINGGSSIMTISEKLGDRMPHLEREIDWLILGGTEYSQVAGLVGIAERYGIQNSLICGQPSGSAYRRLIEDLLNAGVPVHSAQEKARIRFKSGGQLEVMSADQNGCIFLLQHGHAHVLLATGGTPETIRDLTDEERLRNVSAALLAAGGHAVVNSSDWLLHLNPQLTIFSVDHSAPSELPAESVLETLSGRTILRTDLHEDIELITDGEYLWVESGREN
jgi:competence protein ComEC